MFQLCRPDLRWDRSVAGLNLYWRPIMIKLTCGSRCPICGRGCICLINKRNTNSINSTRVSNNTCGATNTNTGKNCSNCSAQLAMKAECETSCSPQLSLYRPTIWNQAFIIQLFLSWSRWERLGGCEIIAYNVDDRVLMMKGFELGEKKWNPWQLHCLLNLDNLSCWRKT